MPGNICSLGAMTANFGARMPSVRDVPIRYLAIRIF